MYEPENSIPTVSIALRQEFNIPQKYEIYKKSSHTLVLNYDGSPFLGPNRILIISARLFT